MRGLFYSGEVKRRRGSNMRQIIFYQSQALWTEYLFRPNISNLNLPFRIFSFIHLWKEPIWSNRFINGCRTWPNWGNIFHPGNLSEWVRPILDPPGWLFKISPISIIHTQLNDVLCCFIMLLDFICAALIQNCARNLQNRRSRCNL